MDNTSRNDSLRSIQEIPEIYRSLFTAYPCFNRVQSAVFNDIILSNSSLVITAPTGSGKTVVFELAILKLMMDYQDFKSLKIVYVAPVKALCNERFNDWQPRFKTFNMSVIEVTGDSLDHCDLQDHQIIITTPEKWDSLTRRWRDNVSLVQMVKLVMIDEVHLLNDSKRGPILETIVCRMKTVMRVLKLQTSLRFIAVSATIFNIEDLAKWLGTNETDYKFYRFGQEVRPVTLNRVVKGYPLSKSPYLFDIQLSYKLKALLVEYADGKPTLIFCSTRRAVVQTCKTLMENISFNFTRQQILVLEEISTKIIDVKLKDFVRLGGGYHHAGMAFEDRLLVQSAFADGILPVLVATSTLAMGVNLPAHLVIIKSTHQYIAGRIVEYSESSILQMVGRAGRPQFDSTATAIIMTKSEMVKKYQNLLDCKEVIESSLHLQLPEQLNAEIVLFTIFDLSVAMQWIQCTFFYLRALKNPQYYGLSGNSNKIEKDLELMVLCAINALKRSQLIDMNENGLDITPTINGRLMSHYYINFNTFQLFFQITEFATVKDVIEILSSANELTEIQLRVNDRRPLNELNINKNAETIRFQLIGKIKTRELKINCLLQACLGCLPMDPTLQQEATRIINVLERIVKCLTEFLTRNHSYCSLLSSVILSKCLHAKLWENSAFVARQLDRIGATLGATLVAFGKTTFNAIIGSHPHELERIVNRGPPFGNLIIEQVRHLPMYSLFVQVDRKSILNYTIHIKISILNKDLLLIHNTAGNNHSSVLIVGDSNNRLNMYKRIFDENILNDNFEISVEIKSPMPQKVFIHVISEQWVGIDLMEGILIDPMAAIVVGSNCHLPNTEKNAKKAKPVEEKKSKAISAKKNIKTVPNKIISKNIPSDYNLDNYCCFDLAPDWIENSPELIDNNTHDLGTNLKLIKENVVPEVPDISSTVPSAFNQDNLMDCQFMQNPESIVSNNRQNAIYRGPVSCVVANPPEYNQECLIDGQFIHKAESIYRTSASSAIANPSVFNQESAIDSQFMRIPESILSNNSHNPIYRTSAPSTIANDSLSHENSKQVLRNDLSMDIDKTESTLQTDQSTPVYTVEKIGNFCKNNIIIPEARFNPETNTIKNNIPNLELNSVCFNSETLDNDIEESISCIESNTNNKLIQDDRYVDKCGIGSLKTLSSFSDDIRNSYFNITYPIRDSFFNFSISNQRSSYDSPYDYNLESNVKSCTSNCSVPDKFWANSSNIAIDDNDWNQQKNNNMRKNVKMPNLLNFATKLNRLTENSLSNDSNLEESIYNIDSNRKKSSVPYDFGSNPSNSAIDNWVLQENSVIGTKSNASNLMNIQYTQDQFPEIDSSSDNSFESNYLITNQIVEDCNGINKLPMHPPQSSLPSNYDKNLVDISTKHVITLIQLPEKVSMHSYDSRSNVGNIESNYMVERNSDNQLVKDFNPIKDSPLYGQPNGQSKNRNGVAFSTFVYQSGSYVVPDCVIDDPPENEIGNDIKTMSSLPIFKSQPNLTSSDEKNFFHAKNKAKTLNQFPQTVSESQNCNFELKSSAEEISVNVMNSSTPTLSEQNKEVSSWQVAEILTPINFNITSQSMAENENDNNIKTVVSQILPQQSFFNTQSVDPSETTTNWNAFEQNLFSSSQKKSKLSSFRERFCFKKSNIPFISQQSQKPTNLTQEPFQKRNTLPPISNSWRDGQVNVVPQYSKVATETNNTMSNQSNFAMENLNNLPKELSYIAKKINKENIPPKSLKSLYAVAQAAKKQSNN